MANREALSIDPETDVSLRYAALLRQASAVSVATACLLIAVKTATWFLTDSVALLSSLADSVLDGMASLVSFLAIRQALQPADQEHRFGHGKAEPLAGLAQAAFVAGSSVFLVVQATGRLVNPVEIKHEAIGIGVMAFSIAATFALVMLQRFVIRRTGSVAISADRLHYVGDMAVNASVILSLVLGKTLGWRFIDPLFGLAISCYLLWNAYAIARLALDTLMDREFPDQDRRHIVEIARSFPQVYDIHDLRTRSSGPLQFIQLHLELERTLTLAEAHAIAEEVILAIRQAFPRADVIIHQDIAGIHEAGHTPLTYRDRFHGEPNRPAGSKVSPQAPDASCRSD